MSLAVLCGRLEKVIDSLETAVREDSANNLAFALGEADTELRGVLSAMSQMSREGKFASTERERHMSEVLQEALLHQAPIDGEPRVLDPERLANWFTGWRNNAQKQLVGLYEEVETPTLITTVQGMIPVIRHITALCVKCEDTKAARAGLNTIDSLVDFQGELDTDFGETPVGRVDTDDE